MLVALLVATVLAQTPPRQTALFVVAQDTAAADAAARLEVRLSRSLAAMGAELLDYDALFPPPPPSSQAEGELLLEEGREAYDNLDMDTAIDRFTGAAIFQIKHPLETRTTQLSDTFIFLGASQLANGDLLGAKEAFHRALLLEPDAKPRSDLFGADVQQAFTELQNARAELPKGLLAIDSVPQGARIFVRGVDEGFTPIEKEVPVGRHHVVLTRSGYASFGAFPEVSAGKRAELRPTLKASEGLTELQRKVSALVTSTAFQTEGISPQAQALAQPLRIRHLILVAVSTDAQGAPAPQASAQAWDLQTGDTLRGVLFTLDEGGRGTDEAAQKIKRWLDRPADAIAPSRLPRVPPVLKKWWFWAAVGGAAAVTVGMVAASRGGRPLDLVLGTP